MKEVISGSGIPDLADFGTSSDGTPIYINLATGFGYFIDNNNTVQQLALPSGGSGTVTSVTSANGAATVADTTTTPVVTIVYAPALKSATTTVDVAAATAPTAGQVLTATDSTHAVWVTPGPAFSAYQSTLQSLPNDTATKLLFQTEEWDTAGCFASSRFTPNVAGNYSVVGCFTLSGAGTSTDTKLLLYKNGSDYKTLAANYPNTAVSCNGTALVSMNGSTDYIELYAIQVSGGALDTVNAQSGTYFQAFLARAA